MEVTLWILIGLLSLLELSRLAAALAGFAPPYRVRGPGSSDAPESFAALLGAALDTPVQRAAVVEPLIDGEQFYPAQLAAIRSAQRSVHLGVYLFQPSRIADRFLEALIERAGAGVEVRVLLDAFGSFRMTRRRLASLADAGGKVEFFHPFRWNTWPRMNHRNHQNLLIIDGRIGFLGGAGVTDYWDTGRGGKPPWRDSVFRVEGGAVAGLQAAFAENWQETTGELLLREVDFPTLGEKSGTPALTVNSSPTAGGASRSRVLFRHLLHHARERVRIATPYFLPNRSARADLIRAMRERGVDIEVLVPGRHSVPLFTRRCSRRHYGELMRAGAKIFEYEPAMMHAKTMVLDGEWVVVGSTNFDPRSFGINEEVNLAVHDPALAAELERQFDRDRARSEAIDYNRWRRRPRWERATELLSAVFEEQQ